MRIADSMLFKQIRENLNKNRTKMSELQNQAATQKRVTKPSDDPVAAARVLQTRVDISGQEQFLKNLNYAKSFLEITDQSLGELTGLMVRAKELALSQASDGAANQQSRRVVGLEVNQLFRQAVNVGNRRLGDRFLFGGFGTGQSPFNATGVYRGDAGEMKIHIDKDSFIVMNVPGNKVFLGENLADDGTISSNIRQPRTIEEFKQEQASLNVNLRKPASLRTPEINNKEVLHNADEKGVSVFNLLKGLEISLIANDKAGVQDSIEQLDTAINQVVLSRSQVGARVNSIDSTFETLQRAKVDNHGAVSQLEDADIFRLVSELSKTESAMQATLNTSGKITQSSLMDFLR